MQRWDPPCPPCLRGESSLNPGGEPMQKPDSVAALTELGRVRLSEHFFMREMLYSEVANHYGLPNVPDDPDLAIEAGTQLCTRILEPLRRAFGHVAVRSAYRSPSVNEFCHQRYKQGDL